MRTKKRAYAARILLLVFMAVCMLGRYKAFAAEAGYGDITFKFYVDNSLRGKEIEMMFMNKETMQFVSITTTEYKDNDLATEMPAGTYELSAIYYDGDWNFNYIGSLSCVAREVHVKEPGRTGCRRK